MNQFAKLTKQQLIDLVVSLQSQPTVYPIDKDPTIFEQPTFPNTLDDVPASKAVEQPKPRMRGYEVRINGVLKHTIIIPNDEQEACRRANWIAKQAAIKGWPSAVKCITL